ncbi:MAG: LAGLIDADG family homing endonuclease [Nanoarchaeota archaeon]|nr:LAGLIDADG family homing endonuclease [Nanoarchaeota archaeon]MBU1320972.1 LAGLIDADG family homing endonuclease [Nanoarchaeota archaeon]MBU1598357.1 LAGLIDADG family homing endonuclease [Nanoarchaeota archaeon]MBU2441741.1 LAGLIDADG family homing endonuclease [Nanoarchaeota archaeon]
MDTDGHVDSSSVGFTSISKELIDNMEDILAAFGISSKISLRKRIDRQDLYLVRVRKPELNKYLKFFGFSNSRKKKKLLQILDLQ